LSRPPAFDRRGVEAVDRLAIARPEGQVQARRRRLAAADVEFVGREVVRAGVSERPV
jgi:hypothetical protein